MPSGCSQPLTSTIAPTTIGPSSTSMTVCAVTLTSLPPTFQTPMMPLASGHPATSTTAPPSKPPFSCSRVVVLTTCTVLPATCQVPSNPLDGRLWIAPVKSPTSSPGGGPPGGGGGAPTPTLTSIC